MFISCSFYLSLFSFLSGSPPSYLSFTVAPPPRAATRVEFDDIGRFAVSYELQLPHKKTFLLMLCHSGVHGYLCEAAIHKQFRAGDVAAVVGCEHHGLGNLIGCPSLPSGTLLEIIFKPGRFPTKRVAH